jgi:hypothetical protein
MSTKLPWDERLSTPDKNFLVVVAPLRRTGFDYSNEIQFSYLVTWFYQNIKKESVQHD